MVQIRQQLALELMREADIATVQEIEREIFSTPWPRNAYYRELASRSSAHYLVLRQEGLVERPAGFQGADFDPSAVKGVDISVTDLALNTNVPSHDGLNA